MADAHVREVLAAYKRGREDALIGLVEGFAVLEKSQDSIAVSSVIEIISQLRQANQGVTYHAETTLAITQ